MKTYNVKMKRIEHRHHTFLVEAEDASDAEEQGRLAACAHCCWFDDIVDYACEDVMSIREVNRGDN